MSPHIQTHTGRIVNPLDLDPALVYLEDIATALANTCRFGGHCRAFYSVAEHSVRVWKLIARDFDDLVIQRAALMHDAAEAYLGDVPTPLKRWTKLDGQSYRQAEARAQASIGYALTVDLVSPWHAIRSADRILLATEARDLMNTRGQVERALWRDSTTADPLEHKITHTLAPEPAKTQFLAIADQLGIREKLRP